MVGCGEVIRMDDGYGWINCGDKLSENEITNPDRIELCDSCYTRNSSAQQDKKTTKQKICEGN